MSNIDDRIVMMKFDNKDFERNAATSMTTLDRLKAKLNFSDMQNGLNSIDTTKLQKEMNKIGDIDSTKFESVLDKLEYRMSSMGIFTARIVENVADDIYNVVRKAMDGIEKVITFAEQGIVQGGYNRAANIESAKFQLEGLGIAWKDIYGDIDYAVTNTAYSLDQAAIVASQLASSGIKPGQMWKTFAGDERDIDTMAMILRSISGTAAATGGKADYADIGRILTKMISYGKVYTSQLNELGTYGIGAKGIIAEYLSSIGYEGRTDWTEAAVSDKMSDKSGGGLDPMVVIEALYEKFAEHATAANTTLTGVMANTRAALARIGEKFFQPIIENGGPLVKFFEALRQSINDLNKAIGPTVESMGKFVGTIIDKVTGNFLQENIDPETGEKSYSLKKVGGIFSSFLEPWKQGEWIETDIQNKDNIPASLPTAYYQEYETRAQKIATNLRDIFQNIVGIVSGFGKTVGAAFSAATGGSISLASILVKITNLLANVTGKLKQFFEFDPLDDAQYNGLYLFFRALFSGIDIVVRFGKSFKKHIIDPIFNAGKAVASAAGVGSWFKDLFTRIYEFDQMLKQEGNEDYFGPFLENVKAAVIKVKDKIGEFFGDIGGALRDGMESIVDWWAPVKDIIFDSDLGFKEKIDTIKAYFTENFELPGWSKVKDIFSGIADAIGNAFDAVKKFFGFGEKDKKVGLATGGGSGYMPNAELSAGAMKDWLDAVDVADTKTEKLSGIGDRISNFFTQISKAFGSVDLKGLSAVGYGILVVLVAVAVGITWVVARIIKGMKKLVIDFPALASKVIESFNSVLTSIAGMFKAQKVANYTQALKNIAIAVAIMSATFMGIAAIVAIVDHFGGGEAMIEGLHTAAAILWDLGIELTALISVLVAVVNLTSGGGYAASLIKGQGLKIAAPGGGLTAVAEIIKAFTASIMVMAGAMILLGIIPQDILSAGRKRLEQIIKIFEKVIFGIVMITGLFTLITGVTGAQAAFAGGMAALASILIAFTTAAVIMTPLIAILGVIPTFIWKKGVEHLMNIVGILSLIMMSSLFIVAIMSHIGNLKGGQVALTLLGLASMLLAIGAAMSVMTIAMYAISKLDPTNMAQGVTGLVLLGAILVAIPAALAYIFSSINKTKTLGAPDYKTMLSLSAAIVAIGISVLIMSKAMKELASIDFLQLLGITVLIGALYGEFAFIVSSMAKIDNTKLKQIAITFGVLGGVMVAMSTLMIILTKALTWDEALTSAAIIFGEMALLFGGVLLINKIVGKNDNGFDNLVKFTNSMAYVAAAMLPMTASIGVLLAVVGGLNIDSGTVIVTMTSFILAMGAISALTKYLLNDTYDKDPKSIKNIAVIMAALAGSVIVMAGSMSIIFAVLSSTGITELGGIGLMLGFATLIVAFGFAVSRIIDSLARIKDVKGVVVPILLSMLAIVVPIAAVAGAMALLVTAVGNSGISATKLLATAGIIVAMVVIPTALIVLANKFRGLDEDQLKQLGVYAGIMVGVSIALALMGNAIAKVAKVPVGQMTTATLCLAAMAVVISVCAAIMARISAIGNIRSALSGIIQFAGIVAGLYLVAGVLKKVSAIDFKGMGDKLKYMAGVVAVVVVVAALMAGISAIFGTGEVLSAAATMLSMAATLAGAGIFMVLAAQGLTTFIDMLLDLDGKADQLSGGIEAFLEGFITGITNGLKAVNAKLEPFLTELGKFFDTLFGFFLKELPKRLQEIGEALKATILAIADFLTDKEVQDAVANIITTTLQFLIDHADMWTEQLVVLAEKIVEGLISGLGIALPNLWSYLDQHLFGGTFSGTGGWAVEAIEEMSDELWHAMWVNFMGYSEHDWALLKKKYGDQLLKAFKFMYEAYELGNEEYMDMLASYNRGYEEEGTGMQKYMYDVLSHFAPEFNKNDKDSLLMRGADRVVDSQKDYEIEKNFEIHWKVNNDTENWFDYSSFLSQEDKIRMAIITGELRKSFDLGWDTAAGKELKFKAMEEIKEALRACDSEEARQEIYRYLRLLGIKVPEGFENGAGLDKKPTVPWKDGKEWVEQVERGIMYKKPELGDTSDAAGQWMDRRFRSGLLGFDESATDEWMNWQKWRVENQSSGILNETAGIWNNNVNTNFTPSVFGYMKSQGQSTANTFMDSTRTVFATPWSAKTKLNLSVSTNVITEGIASGVNAGLSAITGNVQQQALAALGGTNLSNSPFNYPGEMVTAGLMHGMLDSNSIKSVQNNTKMLSNLVVTQIKAAFKIHSPAESERYTGEMITAGIGVGMVDNNAMGYMSGSANTLAAGTESSLTTAFSNIDMSSVGNKLRTELTSKLPTWDSIKSNFGWDKGLSGNIQGVKNVWNQLKSTFGEGGLDPTELLGGLGDQVSSIISGFTDGLGFDGLSLESLGFSISAEGITEGLDIGSIESEFAGFDINDYVETNDLEVNMDINTDMADQWIQDNKTLDIATSIPISGGYAKSTVGNGTYVNNYNYNQTNNSPMSLSPREINRQTEKLLNRNRWKPI